MKKQSKFNKLVWKLKEFLKYACRGDIITYLALTISEMKDTLRQVQDFGEDEDDILRSDSVSDGYEEEKIQE